MGYQSEAQLENCYIISIFVLADNSYLVRNLIMVILWIFAHKFQIDMGYQSEAQLEEQLIKKLGTLGYEFVKIKDYAYADQGSHLRLGEWNILCAIWQLNLTGLSLIVSW